MFLQETFQEYFIELSITNNHLLSKYKHDFIETILANIDFTSVFYKSLYITHISLLIKHQFANLFEILTVKFKIKVFKGFSYAKNI